MSRRDAMCSPMEARTADLKRLVLLQRDLYSLKTPNTVCGKKKIIVTREVKTFFKHFY